ncbi:MAG: hypothetical protein J7521_21530 [Caulobacter sp.]|nr:hypothetical protein [Caulobacter sp.]
MAHILYAVGNATGVAAKLTSVEHSEDNCTLPAWTVTHTGGTDNNWIFLPDCSSSDYWPDHHISVVAVDGSWQVSFWVNDDEGRMLYWSNFDGFSTQNSIPASRDVTDCALMIRLDNGHPIVTWAGW